MLPLPFEAHYARSSARVSTAVRHIEPVIRQPMAFARHIIDLVDFPLAPAGWQAGAHGGHAGWAVSFQGCIALGLPAGEATGLGWEIVEGAHEGVETPADVGGVNGLLVAGGMLGRGRGEAVAAFPDRVVVPV